MKFLFSHLENGYFIISLCGADIWQFKKKARDNAEDFLRASFFFSFRVKSKQEEENETLQFK
jgi:hypothetical protein